MILANIWLVWASLGLVRVVSIGIGLAQGNMKMYRGGFGRCQIIWSYMALGALGLASVSSCVQVVWAGVGLISGGITWTGGSFEWV